MKHTILCISALCISFLGISQGKQDTLQNATIDQCVQYALKHQPIVQQSLLDEQIADQGIKIRLADWFPQVNALYSIQNNPELPTSYFAGNYIKSGTYSVSNAGIGLTQNIFNKDLLLANKTAGDVRTQTKEATTSNKIDVATNVSKAFYDVLLTQKQLDVLDEDITRLQRSLKDAYSQYQGGIVDKTDYKRATISLNNAKAQRKQTADLINYKYAYLKQQMSYPDSTALQLQYDTSRMEADAVVDTNQQINYDSRIEFQLLRTQRKLQEANVKYYKWGYLPTLSAYAGYNFGFLNDNFSKLYSQSFPNSNIGLQVALPIFQGNKRVYQVKQAELQLKRVDWDIVALKNRVNAQYAQALASYKGNLANYDALKENVVLASDVYNVLQLQYQQGIKTYLDVIIAESDLRTSQLNYYTALYQLLQSKVDVQKALGLIKY
jgi:outer membrane protein TolC